MIEVYIDGGCEPNPGGVSSYGIVILRNGRVEEEFSGIVGAGDRMSNNVGEYFGLLKFLEWYGKPKAEIVIVKSDSQLVVNQMGKDWQVKRGLYRDYALQCKKIVDAWDIGKIEFIWIPRQDNLADRLATEALANVGVTRKK